MNFTDGKTKLISACRLSWLAAKAFGLNMSVLYLQFRLWRAKHALKGFLAAIEKSRKRMHGTCQNDAMVSFERTLGEIPVDSLGLQPVIVQALEWDGIHTLKGLGGRVHSLESIPNIGPMRAQMIERAFERRLEKVALQACHTMVMIEQVRNFFGFRDSVMSSWIRAQEQLKQLDIRADDYYADIDYYQHYEGYRLEVFEQKERLWEDAKRYMEEMAAAIRRAKSGLATVKLMSTGDRGLQSMVVSELNGITFTFTLGFFKQIKVKAGRIIGA